MESTIAMQAVAPRVKELQAKYANEPEKLQLETATLYKQSGAQVVSLSAQLTCLTQQMRESAGTTQQVCVLP